MLVSVIRHLVIYMKCKVVIKTKETQHRKKQQANLRAATVKKHTHKLFINNNNRFFFVISPIR